MPGSRLRAPGVCELIILLLALLAFGCNKQAHNEAEEKALARHAEEVQVRHQIIKALNSPTRDKIESAVNVLESLMGRGLLPWADGSPPRNATLELPSVNPEGPYYLTTKFYATFGTNPPQRYVYVVTQTYSNSGFQLAKSWRAGDGGKIAETFPITPPPPMVAARPYFVGPANSGAEMGPEKWYFGAKGGTAEVGTNEPGTGLSCFRIEADKSADGKKNQADLRSESFTLNDAGKFFRPLTFSFAYRLPGKVKTGDNVILFLRFFGPKDDFLGQETYEVGSSTGNSEMGLYRTLTVSNIYAPRHAVTADIWVTANIFGPWSSGEAQFDDFAVTTVAPWPWKRVYIGGGICAGVAAIAGAGFLVRRRKKQRGA